MKQPEALRLADALQAGADDPMWADHCEMSKRAASLAAAELRRLHAEVEEQCRLNGMGSEREAALMAKVDRLERQVSRLHAVNQELLEVLKNLEKEFRQVYPIYYYAEPWGHEINVPLQAARAAIAKATGQGEQK